MVKNQRKQQKKYPSQKRNKACKICKDKSKRYSSSSLGRHIRTMHGQKYTCPYCGEKYREKNNHRFCISREKYLLKFFIDSIKNNIDNNPISIPTIKNSNLSCFLVEDNEIFICPKLKLGQGHFSKVFFGIDKKTKTEIAVKIKRNKDKILSYEKEGKIINFCKKKILILYYIIIKIQFF